MKKSCLKNILVFIFFLSAMCLPFPAQDFSQVEIKTEKAAENIHMLSGGGGNIAVLSGESGILIIDSMFAQIHDKVMTAIKSISDKPVVYLINTHNHYDHVNGNEPFCASGAKIIAHHNVRQQMMSEWTHPFFPTKIAPYPDPALPKITYTNSMTMYFNGDEIELIHMEKAHSDGDTVILFKKANVIHMGDLYFAGSYPFIDVPHGGSVDGIIRAMDRVLDLTDENTKIIPGHGPLPNPDELKKTRDILSSLRDRISSLIEAGKSEEEIIAAKPTSEFDEILKGAFPPEMFVRILYSDLTRKR